MIIKTVCSVALALLITGCSGCTTFQTREQKVQLACASAGTALDVLAVANTAGKLTAAQKNVVLQSAAHVTPVCTAETTPTLDDIKMQAFLQAIAALQANAALVEKK